MLKFGVSHSRSGPVYLEQHGKTITLVMEARTLEVRLARGRVRLGQITPYRVFVIDDKGVRPLRLTGPRMLKAAWRSLLAGSARRQVRAGSNARE